MSFLFHAYRRLRKKMTQKTTQREYRRRKFLFNLFLFNLEKLISLNRFRSLMI